MAAHTLADWLELLESRSPESHIDLGLDRVLRVLNRLGPALGDRPVITVGGTNGKGSVVAYLEQMALASGYRTFAYSSPHLLSFGERMRLDGHPAEDGQIVAALEQVESAREDVLLTYFEHVTLAGLALAAGSPCDILLLEVGLGGRLDAVNAVDPDVSVITSIALDHAAWLGRTRLAVGREKAGIARSGKPLIVGEKKLPSGLMAVLQEGGAELFLAGRDFRWRNGRESFILATSVSRRKFPAPALAGKWQQANAACAVMAIEALGDRLFIDHEALCRGISSVRLPGRFQRIGHSPEIIVDVAHNPAAARCLAAALGHAEGPSTAVFSALNDKDISGIVKPLDGCFDHWLVAPLSGTRGLPGEEISGMLARAAVTGSVETVESVPEALRCALERSGDHGRVVVFGSFHTVAAAAPLLQTLE